MGILADWQIKRDVNIEPFAENEKREGKISYGLSSYGYDARLGYRFRIIKPYPVSVIDPKNNSDDMYEIVEKKEGEYLDIPPHSFVLGETIERFTIPRDVLCVVTGKSTYARCGVYINVTPGEPEWEGIWTVEISNTTPKTTRVYPGEGIMQCLFFRTDGINESMLLGLEYLIEIQSIDSADIKENYLKSLTNSTCKISYADKRGKYQSQTGLTLPKVDESSK